MFHQVKELQYNAHISKPDVRLARLLLEKFVGLYGKLKAGMQYFVLAFSFTKTEVELATAPINGIMNWSVYKNNIISEKVKL
jgi:Mn-containing catalase